MQLATGLRTSIAQRAHPPSALLRALLPRAYDHVSHSHTCRPHSLSSLLQIAPSSRRDSRRNSRAFRQRIFTLASSGRLPGSPAGRVVSAGIDANSDESGQSPGSQLLPLANDAVPRVICRTESALAWLARELAERIGGEGEGGRSGEARGSGERIGGAVGVGDVVCLQGDVGAGKTTFCRHFIRALTGDPDLIVTSPTFLLLNSYPAPALTVHHYDAYRLGAMRSATPTTASPAAAAAAAAAASPDIQRLDVAHSLATGTPTALLAPPALPVRASRHLSFSPRAPPTSPLDLSLNPSIRSTSHTPPSLISSSLAAFPFPTSSFIPLTLPFPSPSSPSLPPIRAVSDRVAAAPPPSAARPPPPPLHLPLAARSESSGRHR
ncbi:unnamed protein product [Closterium sp. NIES-53]